MAFPDQKQPTTSILYNSTPTSSYHDTVFNTKEQFGIVWPPYKVLLEGGRKPDNTEETPQRHEENILCTDSNPSSSFTRGAATTEPPWETETSIK